jgi:uncharacterized repeat protein (TIGR01451 family)
MKRMGSRRLRAVARSGQTVRAVLVAVAAIVTGLAIAALAAASHVDPVAGPDNPQESDCPAGTVGYKVEPVTAGVKSDGTLSVTIATNNTPAGPTFDFTANLPIVTVFVKGGTVSNRYDYDPAATSDTGLHSPVNPANGEYLGLSHLVFCYEVALKVTKTASTSYTRTFEWDIDKSVAPAAWNLFAGDSGTSEYAVDVTKTGSTDSDWGVTGTITIENPSNLPATIDLIADEISDAGGDIPADVDCPVTLPHVLAPHATLTCTYSGALPDGTDRINTAIVKTTGAVQGSNGSAPVDFGEPTTVVNGTVNVEDTNGMSWQFGDSGSQTYTRTFECDEDEGTHENTATITETGQSDSASVTVNCYALGVTKDADESRTKTWTWDIEKTASPTALSLNEGQTGTVTYEVTLTRESEADGHAVDGQIQVHNPAPVGALLTGVADLVSPGIAADVNCGVTFPHTLGAGQTLTCDYSADLPDGASRTNTATATLQNHDYDDEGVGTPSGTTSFTGSAAVDFEGALTSEVDECVDVTDTLKGVLGTVCASDEGTTFQYTLTFGTPGTGANVIVGCGTSSHPNTASFVTNDTETTGSDGATVGVTVTCATPPPPPPPPPAIDLTIVKTASSPTPLNGTVNYRMTVSNKGPSTATNVQLADPAPAGIQYQSATTTQGTCTVTAALVTCSLGTITVGQTVTVDVRARATAVGTHVNTATVSGQGGTETNTSDNSDSAQTVVPKPLTPPTAKPKPKPPTTSACLALTATPRTISADRKPDRVRVAVKTKNKPARGIRVVIKGAGVNKAGRTGAKGVVVLTINPSRPGLLTVTTSERNRKACGARRIGVVGVFAPPLTG